MVQMSRKDIHPCYNTSMHIILVVSTIGWIAGMLVNYFADYFPANRRLMKLYCLQCGDPQGYVYGILPIRCKTHRHGRGIRVWLTLIIYIFAANLLWFYPHEDLSFLVSIAIWVYFGIVTIIDLEHRLILHSVSLVGAALGLAVGIALHGVISTLAGGLIGLSAMFLFYLGGIYFARILSKRRGDTDIDEALGFGDVTLSGVIGLLLGWPGVLIGLIFAVFLAGAVSLIYLMIMLIQKRYTANLTIAYGPYLVVSTIMLLYFKGLFPR